MIASFGIPNFGIISIAKNKENTDGLVNTFTSLRLLLGIFSYIALFIVVLFISKNSETKIMILLSGMFIIINAFNVDWVFNALQELKYVAISTVLKNLIYSLFVFIIFIIFNNNSIYFVPISLFFGYLVSTIYIFCQYCFKYKKRFSFMWRLREYKSILQKSYPFFFSGIFATINCNIDTLMLGLIRSDFEVGLYNSVYKIVSILILFIGFVFTPIYPLLIQYHNEKKYKELEIILNNVRKIINILAVPLGLGALIINKEIILTIYGSRYKEATIAFIILMLYVSILFVREIYAYQLSAWDMQKKYLKVVLISATYNVISNLILIPIYGLNAAAFNTAVSELLNLFIMKK
mgnify:CR=1 FL=1